MPQEILKDIETSHFVRGLFKNYKKYFTIQSNWCKLLCVFVKFILPALTEATSPLFRPIKYSLFPPLGLATLAAYLHADDHAEIADEHVRPLCLEDCPNEDRPDEDCPDLVVIQVYITSAR